MREPSVKCSKCGTGFGDLQYRTRTPEKYNFFGEKLTEHKCPTCGAIILYNWSTGESWIDKE